LILAPASHGPCLPGPGNHCLWRTPLDARGMVRVLCLCLGLCGAVPASADIDDDLRRSIKQMDLLERKANLIDVEYITAVNGGGQRDVFDLRLNDGQSLMLLKDYVRAAIVFHELVDGGKHKRNSRYVDAAFSLGEALFFGKNYIDARTYFRLVLDHERGGPFRRLAMVRLMQIALNTRDFAEVDRYHDRLGRSTGGPSPEGQYLWAKTLILRGRFDDAASAFSTLQAGQPYFFQSRYFLGVVHVRKNEYDKALAVFDKLVRLKPKWEAEREVVELGHLARGRLLHDMGQEVEALDAFQAIEHSSLHFDDALLEICWTYVQLAEKTEQPEDRKKWLLEAFRTLEILEVSTPDSTLVPRAHLMQGHVLEKMIEFDKAAEMFAKVAGSYASVKEELDRLMKEHDDPVRYFNEVAGRNLESFDLSSYLPPLAVKWMSQGDQMAVALGVTKDIETGRQFVKEARALLDQLDALLVKEADRINLFPLYREGAKRTIEVQNARVILERNMVRLEERVVMEYVSASERQAMEAVRKEREKLEGKLDGLPTTRQAMEGREQRIRRRIEDLVQAVYQSGIALKGMKAQLGAMEEWLRQHDAELKGRQAAVKAFREELRRGWHMAEQLQKDLDSLQGQLSTEKARAGMDADSQNQEERLRQLYAEAVAKERLLSDQIHDRLGSEGTARVASINQLRLRSERLRRKLKQVRENLDKRVEAESAKLRAKAQAERNNIDAYSQSLDQLDKETENLAGEVAFATLKKVRDRFHKLVLEAEVGILDVAWGRKQSATDKISELGRKLGAERKRLHKEFKSVLQQVE